MMRQRGAAVIANAEGESVHNICTISGNFSHSTCHLEIGR